MKDLRWEKDGNGVYQLQNGTETLVRLFYSATGKPSFELGGTHYAVARKGFWNIRYVARRTRPAQQEEHLSFSHNFWGQGGTLTFSDGSVYKAAYKLSKTLSLLIRDQSGRQVLSYHVENPAPGAKTVLQPGNDFLDGDKLLVMAALGMIVFLGMFNEFNNQQESFTSWL